MLRFPYPTRRGNKPGFKGVRPCRDKFVAQVHRGGRRFHLGTYLDQHQAAFAVNQALAVLYPDLPRRFLNDIPDDHTPSPEDQESIRREVRFRLGPDATFSC
jgi:hypothetical protein